MLLIFTTKKRLHKSKHKENTKKFKTHEAEFLTKKTTKRP